MSLTTIRLTATDRKIWFLAASKEQVSLSEFLRRALRSVAQKVLE
jgi:hypothetical protein